MLSGEVATSRSTRKSRRTRATTAHRPDSIASSLAGPGCEWIIAEAAQIERIEHAEIAASRDGEFAGDEDQSPDLGRGAQEAVDGGE